MINSPEEIVMGQKEPAIFCFIKPVFFILKGHFQF